MTPADWIGRKVMRSDTTDDKGLGEAVVLAVDDTAYAPSAWIKYPSRYEGNEYGRDYPAYRSIDLSDLVDIETGETGPRWGTGTEVIPISGDPQTQNQVAGICLAREAEKSLKRLPGDFRIMPRQTDRDEDHQRWGFFITGHPKGDPDRDGLYLASWVEWDHAVAAAHCLGVSPYEIQPVTHLTARSMARE